MTRRRKGEICGHLYGEDEMSWWGTGQVSRTVVWHLEVKTEGDSRTYFNRLLRRWWWEVVGTQN